MRGPQYSLTSRRLRLAATPMGEENGASCAGGPGLLGVGDASAIGWPTQMPDSQWSFSVHTVPSSQAVPSGAGAALAQPRTGSHAPAWWQGPASQTMGLPPTHAPFWQLSIVVHTFWSSHAVPFATGVCMIPCAGSHASMVQGLWSSADGGAPGV